MTVLAIRLANITNGVSKLHGSVSRKMWKNIWPELPDAEVPIIVDHQRRPHPQLGVARHEPALRPLPRRAVGRPADRSQRLEARRDTSPTPSCGGRTNGAANGWWPSPAPGCKQQLKRRGAPPAEIARADEVLDPEALTIGFARRFATYKRGTLIFRNLDRLAAIINDKDRPVQILFAGKAHPKRPRRQGADRRDPARSPAGRSSAAASSSSKTTT